MKCLTGSRYFFSSYEDFDSKDHDYVELIETEDNERRKLIHDENGYEVYQWKLKDKTIMLEEVKNIPTSGEVVAFLIPEFANEIGLTIDELKTLEDNIYAIAEKYKSYRYYKIIYDSYIKNKAFKLTAKQRLQAYNEYKLNRRY